MIKETEQETKWQFNHNLLGKYEQNRICREQTKRESDEKDIF